MRRRSRATFYHNALNEYGVPPKEVAPKILAVTQLKPTALRSAGSKPESEPTLRQVLSVISASHSVQGVYVQ